MGEIQMLRQLKRGWQACSRDSSRTDSAQQLQLWGWEL